MEGGGCGKLRGKWQSSEDSGKKGVSMMQLVQSEWVWRLWANFQRVAIVRDKKIFSLPKQFFLSLLPFAYGRKIWWEKVRAKRIIFFTKTDFFWTYCHFCYVFLTLLLFPESKHKKFMILPSNFLYNWSILLPKVHLHLLRHVSSFLTFIFLNDKILTY